MASTVLARLWSANLSVSALGVTAKRLTRDPALWLISFANPGMVLGVMWAMTEKPGTGIAIVAVVVGYALGAALALRLSRAPAVVPEPAATSTP